jgi:hypothetical protein
MFMDKNVNASAAAIVVSKKTKEVLARVAIILVIASTARSDAKVVGTTDTFEMEHCTVVLVVKVNHGRTKEN